MRRRPSSRRTIPALPASPDGAPAAPGSASPLATASDIITVLERIAGTGHPPSQVFRDWLTVSENTLAMLPAHVRAMTTARRLAEDTPEVAKVWADLRERYRPEAFPEFARAFATLLDSTVDGAGRLYYQDALGSAFMVYGHPNDWAGQFFTPFRVATALAMAVSCDGRDVHERLKEAIAKSPAASAALLAGLTVSDEGDARQWFIERVLPFALEHYQPVTVCDPCCGSGVMLLAAASTYPRWMVELGLVQFYGVDIDPTCVQMARLNVRLYGLNGSAIQDALALSDSDLSRLPQPYAATYRTAREAAQNGDDTARRRATAAVRRAAAHAPPQLTLFT